jgi:hypothetical protein
MNLTTLLLVTGFPFLVPIVASAVLWRKLDRKWLFLVVSVLCIFAIANLSLDGLRDLLVPPPPDPLPVDLLSFNIETAHQNHLAMLLTDAIVLVVGVPLLAWLFSTFRKPRNDSVV